MNHTRRTIHDVLTAWGRLERQLPADNERLKNEALMKLQSASAQTYRAPLRLPWLSLAFTGLAMLTLFITIAPGRFNQTVPLPGPVPLVENTSDRESVKNFVEEKVVPGYYTPPRPEAPPITDSREFLKTDYNAAIRTRRVEELTQRIQIIVRGFGGRVDTSQSSPTWGYINFAVPADRFDSFRNELKDLVYARLLTENVSAENLLPQKQSIEQQQNEAQQALARLRLQRDALTTSHRRAAAALQSELAANAREAAALAAEVTVDPTRQAQIAARLGELTHEKSALQGRLADENKRYARELSTLDAQIRDQETNLDRLGREDQTLLDTAATVRGTISLNWISVWGILDLYLPFYWFTALFALGAIVAYFIHRRRLRLIEL